MGRKLTYRLKSLVYKLALTSVYIFNHSIQFIKIGGLILT